MKVAMISYNTFVDGEHNGWKNNGDNSVLLLQNSNGSKWGMTQNIPAPRSEAGKQWNFEAKTLLDPLWEELKRELPTIDKVVFYVGSDGAERVIDLAGDNGLTPDHAIFVMCDCNMSRKMGVVRDRGFSSSQRVMCECGGHNTMNRIYRSALNGSLPN